MILPRTALLRGVRISGISWDGRVVVTEVCCFDIQVSRNNGKRYDMHNEITILDNSPNLTSDL